jgi:glyoxylase-like metal-dependent hydrolase (beta-lactamase superfamily II)/rhodanese-related sulfurtransferase
MKIEQIYTGCIAHAAYYVESNGEAAIFDPLREVGPYIDRAKQDEAQIKYVFLTHFHADFVSGHLDLAQKTGAKIVYGSMANPAYEIVKATDGQIFEIGDYKIKVIHTPGHTLESTTYLLIDECNNEHGIVTGDTLFIGDVGRPDLAQHVIAELTQDKLARLLYHSLRNKIMPLPDHLIVYPNHGAGSACGKMMRKETTDTLGNQKKTNYALNPKMNEDVFVEAVLSGLTSPPAYFPSNVLMNINGYESLDTVLEKAMNPLEAKSFELIANSTNALILDTRSASEFAKCFIPNSVNIGLEGSFAMWVGEMIKDVNQKILLVTEPGYEEESMIRLSRIGFDGTIGFLKGGIESWVNAGFETENIRRISAIELQQIINLDQFEIFDVRKKSEFDSEHLICAINIPLNELNQHLSKIPKNTPFVIYCGGGYRSMIAASILKQRGWFDFVDVIGGFNDIKKTSLDVSPYQCPSTLL